MAPIGLMGWRRRWRMRRAAKRYARRLGPYLRHAYGASEHYSLQQVCAAAVKLGLDADFIALGLAEFLPEEEFAAREGEMRIYIPFAEARELIARFRPRGGFAASHHYESGLGMSG